VITFVYEASSNAKCEEIQFLLDYLIINFAQVHRYRADGSLIQIVEASFEIFLIISTAARLMRRQLMRIVLTERTARRNDICDG